MISNGNDNWVPDRGYTINLKIKNHDLTMSLTSLTIVTSINLPYQSFFIDVMMDSNTDIILEKIYGQVPMNLTISLHATDQYPLERVEIELMYVDSSFILSNKPQLSTQQQHDKSPMTITAVPTKAYRTMNSFVNEIYEGKKINEVITDLIQNSGGVVVYDNNDQNPEPIDQVLVPPSTLYNNLKYINRTFGIFNGAPSFFCLYDNRVFVKNLTSKMRQAQTFTLYQLAMGENNEDIIRRCNDGKSFYTTEPLLSEYKGNSVFATLAPNSLYIVKPKDRIVQNININLEAFTKKYGLISKNTELFFDKQTIKDNKRIGIHKDHTGYEISDTFINSNKSLSIAEITNITANLQQSLKITNLMNVGESVEVISQNVDSSDINGRYILKSCELRFQRFKDWETKAKIMLIRSNRTMS